MPSPPLGAGERVQTVLRDTTGEALALRGAEAGATALGWSWKRSPSASSRRGREWRWGGGVGGKEGDKEPPCLRGERPLSQSPIVRRISDYAGLWCPREGEAELSSGSRVFVYLGRGRGSGGSRPGRGLGVHFRASPLRKALPYLSHRPPPCSRTCILKAPCSPGIGQGRVLRAQKLEPPGGGLEAGWLDCTISSASPACAPPLPHTPREAQSDGREGGTAARMRLWQGAGRAGARRWGTSGAGRASARPLAPPRRRSRPRRPAPSPPGVGGAAGAPGAGPGAGLRLLRPNPESARHGGRRRSSGPSSPSPEPRGSRAAPGGRCVRAREAARGGPHAPPAAPCP